MVLRYLVAAWFAVVGCADNPPDIPPGHTQKEISFKAPKFNEEQDNSKAFPDDPILRCDSCGVIVQQLAAHILQMETTRKRPLPESDTITIVEHVCRKGFDKYGVKDIEGQIRYNGPGTWPHGEGIAGMIQGGGTWETRLNQACTRLVGDVGDETEIYSKVTKYISKPKDARSVPSLAELKKLLEELCMEKKKKKKKRSSQDIRNSCPKYFDEMADTGASNFLYLTEKQWTEIYHNVGASKHKIEL